MSVIYVALNRLSELPEPVMYAAYAAVGWILYQIFGPEHIDQETPTDSVLKMPQSSLVEPVPLGELSRH